MGPVENVPMHPLRSSPFIWNVIKTGDSNCCKFCGNDGGLSFFSCDNSTSKQNMQCSFEACISISVDYIADINIKKIFYNLLFFFKFFNNISKLLNLSHLDFII